MMMESGKERWWSTSKAEMPPRPRFWADKVKAKKKRRSSEPYSVLSSSKYHAFALNLPPNNDFEYCDVR